LRALSSTPDSKKLHALAVIVRSCVDPFAPVESAKDVPSVGDLDSVQGGGGLRIWRGSRGVINESC
jgi:hypothetical protein